MWKLLPKLTFSPDYLERWFSPSPWKDGAPLQLYTDNISLNPLCIAEGNKTSHFLCAKWVSSWWACPWKFTFSITSPSNMFSIMKIPHGHLFLYAVFNPGLRPDTRFRQFVNLRFESVNPKWRKRILLWLEWILWRWVSLREVTWNTSH